MRRRHRILNLRDSLCQQYYLRLHMTLLLLLTAGAAALFSRALLFAGVATMAWRYPLAAFLSYGVFLVLVRLWLWYVSGRGPDDLEPDDPSGFFDWSLPDLSLPDFSWDFDADDGFTVLLLALVLVAGCCAGFYLIWTAPALLSEIAVEFLLAGSLHGGLTRARRGHWVWPTLERTWLTLVAVLVLASLGGWVLQQCCPDAVVASAALRCPVER